MAVQQYLRNEQTNYARIGEKRKEELSVSVSKEEIREDFLKNIQTAKTVLEPV
jgi:hypothetical protein